MQIDLTGAVVVTPDGLSRPEQKAVAMLLEEVAKRTRITWRETHAWPVAAQAVVVVGPAKSLAALAGPRAEAFGPIPDKPEGYRLQAFAADGNTTVIVAGNDARGVLYGVGRLLRELRMERDRIHIPANLDIATSPAVSIRGHQLGYRPKTNSYDAWTVEMWEQYIRDLAVFGANAVELIPPRSDDAPDSPHFPLPQLEMMKRMSQICDDYDIDVWIWYPALDKDYTKTEDVEFALKEWGDVFAQLPRIDHVVVPGGDPGHTPPRPMFDLVAKQADNLRRTHPKAGMWMSSQGFTQERMDEFLHILCTEQPKWLAGIVFGPQNRVPLPEFRKLVPPQYPIRHYPDITHTVQCQFPVPEWSYALAITEQRECVNPRPTQYARIFRLTNPDTVGFLSYSEGCNDDINKTVWSGLGWNPDVSVIDILRDYARYFIDAAYADTFAQGILALERNWTEPLATNAGVLATLAQFRDMERSASPRVKLEWRFQQALYRAYYDAYIYRRLAYETELEREAMEALRQATSVSAPLALDQAERILNRAVLEPVSQDLRAHIFELAEALYQSVRMQLSVPRYQAIDPDRGANLDLIDLPLNNRTWLFEQFTRIRALPNEPERLREIDAIVNWTNPGPGGFYDDLGSLTQQPHLIKSTGTATYAAQSPDYPDPEFRTEPIMAFEYDPRFRATWNYYAETRYDSPLILRYETLDPAADYKVRVIYAGDSMERRIRLAANGVEVHPFIDKPDPPKPLEFDIPLRVAADGLLTLSWTQEPGRGGNGRGCQVAEVWLIRKTK